MNQVYFDNAATSFPKPPSVKRAIAQACDIYGGNPGRSGHAYSAKAGEMVYDSRAEAAGFFGAEPENVIFTANCTHALNIAIKGIVPPGGRLVISSMEHNSVARPSYALSKRGVTVEVAQVGKTDEETIDSFRKLITPQTDCVVCTYAGNVTGRIMPIREIARLCRAAGACFIVDGAQACGIIPVSLSDGMNIICTAGHKGLYGGTGTGLIISDGKYEISPIMEGGTGATSAELWQTPFMPERLECGTLNTIGIASLRAGIRYVSSMGLDSIYRHEEQLCDIFIDGLKVLQGVTLYRCGEHFVPIVSFNLDGVPSERLAAVLSDNGFALRGGLHCAPLAHGTIKTMPQGTVRFSPSVFSSERDVLRLVDTIKKLSKDGLGLL